jgi:2-aminoethylphosphonate-pyruvate transaminase
MHFTPPVQTIYSVYQALTEIEEESLDKKYIRHKKSFETLKKGMTELGFKYYVADEHSAKLLLSVIFPNDVNWSFKFIHDYCYERGFTIYPGKAINSSFRLSVFGSINYRDIESFLTVFKAALKSKRITTPVNYN